MTLLFCESFDAIGPDELATYGKWLTRVVVHTQSGFGGYATINLVPGRLGASALRLGCSADALGFSEASISCDLLASHDTIFLGFGWLDNQSAADITMMTIMNIGRGNQIAMAMNSGRFLYLNAGGATRCTSNTVSVLGVWYWLEIAAFISATAGWLELRSNQVLVATYYGTGSSRATANGNTATITTAPTGAHFVQFGSSVSRGATAGATQGADFSMDDLVIQNALGTLNNDFPNECQVSALLPIATGAFTQFVRGGTTPAATNWQSVDELNINDDVDYVAGQTVGLTDSYDYTTLPPQASSIRGIQFSMVARKDVSGFKSYRAFARIPTAGGPLDATIGPDQILGASYTQARVIAETRPDGPIWTPSDIVLSEFGFRLTA